MNEIKFEIDQEINWDRVSHMQPYAYNDDKLKELELSLAKEQRFEEASIIRDEILLRKLSQEDANEISEVEYKSKIIQLSPLINFFKSLPKLPGSRTEAISLYFKYTTAGGVYDAQVNKIKFRGIEEYYHCTLSRSEGNYTESHDVILSSNNMDENASERIQVPLNVPKQWDDVRDWSAWNFDVVLSGKTPEIIIL